MTGTPLLKKADAPFKNPYLIEKQKASAKRNDLGKAQANNFNLLNLLFTVPKNYQKVLDKKISIGQVISIAGAAVVGGVSLVLYAKTKRALRWMRGEG